MIIKRVRIKNFGKLKNRDIKLTEGINIIYGENEQGKSTLQGFIKTMLYGFSSTRTKDVKNNDRLRYSPWSGERMSGEILIDHEGREVVINRTFGSTKKEDGISVVDALTGKTIEKLKDYSPGNSLLELNSDAFEKTLNIKQLNSYISKSKEDDLLQRISNLKGSGEEGVSYDKALQDLQYEKKLIKNNRKSGSLDLAEIKLSQLYEKYHKYLRLSEENIESRLKLNTLLESRDQLKKEIKNLEIYKRHIKKSKLHKEYKQIVEYLKKSENLKEEKLQAQEKLITSEGMIDDLFIKNLEEEAFQYTKLRDDIFERQDELEDKKELYEDRLKRIEESYNGFIDTVEGFEGDVIKLSAENDSLYLNLKQQESINEELARLKEELRVYERGLGPILDSEEVYEEGQELIKSYQERLKELKEALEKSRDFPFKKLKAKKDKNLLTAGSLGIIGLALGIFGITMTTFSIGLKTVLIVIGAVSVLASFFIFYRTREVFNLLKEHKGTESYQIGLKKSIQNMEERLQELIKSLNLSSYEDFLKSLKIYSQGSKSINVLKIKIQDREENLKGKDFQKLKEDYEESSKKLRSILERSSSKSLEDFLLRLKEYKRLHMETELLKREIMHLEAALKGLWDNFKLKEEGLRERLNFIGLKDVSMDRLPFELSSLREKLKKLQEVEGELKAINATYEALLKERDIESIKEEVMELDVESLQEDYSNEEDIENKIRELNDEYLNTEKAIKDTENFLDNLFRGIPPLWQIEEELENTKEEISYFNRRLKVLDIAIENLEESYKEIQKSFGPILNKEVGRILKKVTNDKYNEVKISEEYAITLRDSEENLLFNGEYLSSGTFDQAYLSLRLAIIKLIFGEKQLPIILDDAFIQYDDERLKNTLNFLRDFAEDKQIIIFTCQNRELKLLEDSKINKIIL